MEPLVVLPYHLAVPEELPRGWKFRVTTKEGGPTSFDIRNEVAVDSMRLLRLKAIDRPGCISSNRKPSAETAAVDISLVHVTNVVDQMMMLLMRLL